MSGCQWYGCVVCGELRRAFESDEDDPDCHCAPPERPQAARGVTRSEASVLDRDRDAVLSGAPRLASVP